MNRKNIPSQFDASKSRRNVLKTFGVGAVALSAGPIGRVTARSKEQFEGVVYDPVTKRILGQGYGTATRKDDSLNGALKLNGAEYSLDTTVADTSKDGRTNIFVEQAQDAVIDVFSTEQSALSGIVRRPDGQKVAFYLGSQRLGMNPDELRESIKLRQSTKIVRRGGKSPRKRGEQ